MAQVPKLLIEMRLKGPSRVGHLRRWMQLERHTVAIPRNPLTLFLPLSALLLVLVQSGCAGYTTKDAAPSIMKQPANQTVTAGQTATFSASATGTAPLSYQWNKNGTAISGATFPSYTTPAETTSGSGARFTVMISNSAGSAISDAATLTVSASPSGASLQIATSSLLYAEVGTQFQAGLSASGGVQPYRWSIVSGTLSPAFSLNPNTGALSGTASQEGQLNFSVQVSDSSSPNPQTAMKALILSVLLALQIAPSGLPNGEVGVAYEASLGGTGGKAPYTWNIVGAAPSGLSLNSTSGVITGMPTQSCTSIFTVVLTDSVGQTAQKSSTITIAATGPPVSGEIVITPSIPPAVNQGTTFQFTANAPGTWSCSGTDSSGAATACKGSINPSTGLYTAPATVTAQQSAGGYQMLPNNHIFNTRIDSFPLRSDSVTLIAGTGTSPLNYTQIAKPINYTNSSTPTQSAVFYYTPANNGTYEIPAFPGVFPTEARIEGGWISAQTNQNADHHLLTIDTTNGNMQDIYQWYTIGLNGSCPTCNSQSGVKYTASSYSLPAKGATDAAGMYMTPLVLRPQEVEQAIATGGTINHALRMTFANGYLHNAFLWPATTSVAVGGGLNYYGERVRLSSSFNISKFSPVAQILLKQMQQYGLIIADGGTGWAVDIEYAKWPTAVVNAFLEISVADIAPSNFEVVDESGYMLSSSSGEATSNREIVTFTHTSSGATASVDVVLTGVTVNFPYDLLQIQVGAPAQQLTALVNGASNTNVTWRMNPSVGTLSSSGLYTPPSNVSSPTTITVTATSVANPSVAVSMTLNVFPAGPIRLVPGSVPGTYNYSVVPTTYTDTSGNVWYSIGDDGGYAYNRCNSISGTSDPQLYCWEYAGYTGGGNDVRFDFIVPNGSYQITYKGASTFGTLGTQIQDLEVNGNIVFPNLDLYGVSGGSNIAWDWGTSVTVTNNKLSFVQRVVNNLGTHIGALEITQ